MTVNYQAQDLSSILAEILSDKSVKNLDPRHRRRLEIILRSHLGQSQVEICSALGCSKDMARYWMAIAKKPASDSWQDTCVGRPKRVSDEYLQRLQELVTSSPQDHGYAFKRWTARCLSQHLSTELGIEISDRHVNRLLKQMGLSTRNSQDSANAIQSSSNSKSGRITIQDLNPSASSQLNDSLWWFQNQI
ncbi:transposase [Pleurocapsa sp. CCALA 161]|uniref:helix-turn-helix domain-containing protein n=1 Tax=Pleurocapsa sp. CCALA 161 TaxID=2107688 RepID=UPI000D07D567|nr:helix-turn-helix domain-containing protein [Pleurocapsa sp. CCALA 161]PSB09133.1 transposase [Pleurocapsa sp. CCALA 161]